MDQSEVTEKAAPAEEAKAHPEAAGKKGDGYDPRFLPGGHVLDAPAATSSTVLDDYAPTKAGDRVRHYMHFSLAMSAQRRFCRWVAWNIDGGGLLEDVGREGIPFVLDGAYEAIYQVGDDVYSHNAIDRGHIARRADLLWGSRPDAERANTDSFFFTNITPQVDDFNQSSKHGLWGELENAIFKDAEVEDLRLSLFGGPIFKETDLPYRNVLVPRSFWKVIGYVEKGTLKANAYVLTQDDLESKVQSLGLEKFRLYQLSLPELTKMIDLDFGPLTAADTMEAREGILATSVREIESREELVVG